jgi:hypothetical protein
MSGFVRQAALQASAVVERKTSVKAQSERAEVPERESTGIVLLDEEPAHHFVEGLCVRCGRDVNERNLPCSRQRKCVR